MQRKFLLYLLLFLLTLAVISIVIAYRIWNTPHKDVKNAEAVEVTAVGLYDSLSNNNTQAKSVFVNKVVAVTGRIKRIIQNQHKQQVILLETNREDASINCTMEENIKDIKAGKILTVKGICLGYSGGDITMGLPGDVFLVRCYGL